jgi:hypothetical protein
VLRATTTAVWMAAPVRNILDKTSSCIGQSTQVQHLIKVKVCQHTFWMHIQESLF